MRGFLLLTLFCSISLSANIVSASPAACNVRPVHELLLKDKSTQPVLTMGILISDQCQPYVDYIRALLVQLLGSRPSTESCFNPHDCCIEPVRLSYNLFMTATKTAESLLGGSDTDQFSASIATLDELARQPGFLDDQFLQCIQESEHNRQFPRIEVITGGGRGGFTSFPDPLTWRMTGGGPEFENGKVKLFVGYGTEIGNEPGVPAGARTGIFLRVKL
ncbi:MAG: hypothetical protein K1X79_14345 [Oligoflexia bacterium]|nr:hypothetical protein [Oligoflexia bacterium]